MTGTVVNPNHQSGGQVEKSPDMLSSYGEELRLPRLAARANALLVVPKAGGAGDESPTLDGERVPLRPRVEVKQIVWRWNRKTVPDGRDAEVSRLTIHQGDTEPTRRRDVVQNRQNGT
jgi:hypothetical protein